MNALEKEYQTDYLIRQKESANDFFRIVRNEIKKIAKEEKYLIIIQNESVFWANNSLDITENILEILNEKQKKEKS